MFKKLLATPYALFMLLFVILPIVLIAVYAFTDAEGAIDLIGNFQDLAKEESLGKVVRNSVIAGLSTAVICLVIGYPIAYYLTKSEFNRTGVLIGLFLVPMWVNFLLRMMSTKAALNALHIEMGMGTVIFGLCYEFLPFMIMPIYTTIQKIDKSLIEGADRPRRNSYQSFLESYRSALPSRSSQRSYDGCNTFYHNLRRNGNTLQREAYAPRRLYLQPQGLQSQYGKRNLTRAYDIARNLDADYQQIQ